MAPDAVIPSQGGGSGAGATGNNPNQAGEDDLCV